MVAVTKQSFRDTLRTWHSLERRKRGLERALSNQQELYISMHLKLTPSGIQSTVIQQYQAMDMPRGSDVGDKTGNLVANALDGQQDASDKIREMKHEYIDVCAKISHIEAEIEILYDEHREVLRRFYRDRENWQDITSIMNISKTHMYRMIDDSIDAIESALWR